MATPTTTKKYSPTERLPANVAGPIQSQISQIQAGIDRIKARSAPSTPSAPQGGAVVGGRIIGAGGADLGAADPADIQGAGSPRVSVPTETITAQPKPASPQAQISPATQAPQALVDQTNQLQQGINQLATQRGITLTPDGKGGYVSTPNVGQGIKDSLALAKASGKQAPDSAAVGSAIIGGNVPQGQEPQTSPQVDAFYLEDKNVTAQTQEIIDFLSPPSTQQMLVDGMKQIQTQQAQLSVDKFTLMNLETVMSGSAEDIAKEIEASGGIGTSSLVASLAVARNSTLLKQASFLQNKIAMQQDLIANSTQLLSFEKEMANTQFAQRLGVMQYVQQNNDRMMNAFRDSVDTIQKTVGWAGFKAAYAGNPRQLGYVESLYGGAGSLDRLATEEQRQASIVTPEEALKLENLRLQNEKLRRGEQGKPLTQEQLKIAGYKDRLIESNQVILRLGQNFTSAGSYLGEFLPNLLKSSERQSFEQAKRNFINAVLRRESGAAISPSEFKSAEEQYFPQPGDAPSTLQQKSANRFTVINSFARESASAASRVLIAPDGQEIEIID